MECSGNHGLPFFIGGIGNARWAGTPLAPLLKHAGVLEQGTEVIFWGADSGQVTIRDNSGSLVPARRDGRARSRRRPRLDHHRAIRPQHVPGGGAEHR